jgi:hypothetical protein
VFCPRNDRVGTVIADAEGYAIEYTAQVWHFTAIFGATSTDRLHDDEAAMFTGYCKSCRRGVMLSGRFLREQAVDGVREVKVPFAAAVDKQWVDAGREAIYPSDLKSLRHDPRQSEDGPPTSGNV